MRTSRSAVRAVAPVVVVLFFAAGMVGAQTFSPERPQDLYRRGVDASLSGEPYRALELFGAAIRANPRYADPILGSAEIYFQLGEYDHALRLVSEALIYARNDSRALALRGRVLIGLGRLKEASDAFASILRLEPNNVDARLGRAELEAAEGKNRSAAALFQEALAIDPDNRRALLSLALLFQHSGDGPTAEDYLRLAIRHHGEHPSVRVLAADYYLRQGLLREAEAEARTALTIQPGLETAQVLLARIAFQKGDFEEAASAAEEAIRGNRRNDEAWFLKAMASLRKGGVDQAISSLTTLVSVLPDHEVARISLEDIVTTFLQAEDPRRAGYATYRVQRGHSLRDKYFYERALLEYRRAVQIDPYSKEARVSYAQILGKLGYPARSLAELEVLAAQKSADNRIEELIEIGRSLQENSVSARWKVDQFQIDRESSRMKLAVFLEAAGSELQLEAAGGHLLRSLSGHLLHSQRLSLVGQQPTGGLSYSQAFQEARLLGSDYFILVSFADSPREFFAQAEFFLTRTGTRLHRFQTYRTGNDRVQNGLVQLTERIVSVVPFRGELVRRNFDRGLVNIGRTEGLKPGDEMPIVANRAAVLANESGDFRVAGKDVVGTFTVTAVDDLIAEGRVVKKGFFDAINTGDVLVRTTVPEGKGNQEVLPPRSALYQRLSRIQ